jgi:hypothetical protein
VTLLKLPSLIPIVRSNIGFLYKLLFNNDFSIYFSYQHPIAFAAAKHLKCNKPYWERRRLLRNKHKEMILADYKFKTVTTLDETEFETMLVDRLSATHIIISNQIGTVSRRHITI